MVDRISPVASSMTVTVVSSAMARTRVPVWAAPMPEVVHAPGAAEAHFAVGVEHVVAESVVAGLSVAGRGGFG